MTLDAETFKSSELTISVQEQSDGVIHVAWLGTSDARDPARELTPFLTGLAGRLAGRSVDVDFRKLEYMNSGTVSPIIQFTRALDSAGAKARLLYDTKVGWQRVNFVCLKNIAKTLNNVLVEG